MKAPPTAKPVGGAGFIAKGGQGENLVWTAEAIQKGPGRGDVPRMRWKWGTGAEVPTPQCKKIARRDEVFRGSPLGDVRGLVLRDFGLSERVAVA